MSFMQPQKNVGPSTIQREMWICDACKVQKFEHFDEACRHERACKIQQKEANRANFTAAVDKSASKLISFLKKHLSKKQFQWTKENLKARDLNKLGEEEEVEVTLDMPFASNYGKDYGMILSTDHVFEFKFSGKNTGACLEFQGKCSKERPPDEVIKEFKVIRDTLMTFLTRLCKKVQTLKIMAPSEDIPFEMTEHGVGHLDDEFDLIDEWADPAAVLYAFDRARHWNQSLQKLHLANRRYRYKHYHSHYSFSNTPENLKEIKIELGFMSQDNFANYVLRAFPGVETVAVWNYRRDYGRGEDDDINDCLPSILENLHEDCQSIRNITIGGALKMCWEYNDDEDRGFVLETLQKLPKLEKFAYLPEFSDMEEQEPFLRDVLKILPRTNIRRLDMPAMPCDDAAFKALFEAQREVVAEQVQDLSVPIPDLLAKAFPEEALKVKWVGEKKELSGARVPLLYEILRNRMDDITLHGLAHMESLGLSLGSLYRSPERVARSSRSAENGQYLPVSSHASAKLHSWMEQLK